MIKTMKSRGYYVLCYSKDDYFQKKGETKKIGPFVELELKMLELKLKFEQVTQLQQIAYSLALIHEIMDNDRPPKVITNPYGQ